MLPIQTSPKYTLTIPSTGKEVKFRPFLVKDQKALLIAQASEDSKVMVETLKSIIYDCVEGIENVKLATFDLEYIFTQLRAKSVGEVVELQVKCSHCNEDKNVAQINIDITTIEVDRHPEHNNVIPLFEDVGVTMAYPSIDTLQKYQDQPESVDVVFDVIVSCIDSIYQGEKVFYAHEQSKEQLLQFVENLTADNFAKIKFFFDSVPKITKNIDFQCPACSAHNHVKIEGITSFF